MDDKATNLVAVVYEPDAGKVNVTGNEDFLKALTSDEAVRVHDLLQSIADISAKVLERIAEQQANDNK